MNTKLMASAMLAACSMGTLQAQQTGVPPQGIAPPSAATAAAPTTGTTARSIPVTLNVTDQPLEDVVKLLAQQTRADIWVEPGINPRVTAALNRVPLESALGTILGANGPLWARADLRLTGNVQVPREPIFDLARGFSALNSPSLVAGLSGGAGTVTLTRGGAAAPVNPSTPDGLRQVTAYVIANRKAGLSFSGAPGGPATENVAAMNQATHRRFELMQQMTPEERQKAYQDEMVFMMQLSPEMRRQMQQDRRNAMRNMPEDLRNQLRSVLGPGGGGGRGNRGPGGRGRNPNPAGTPVTPR